LLKPRFFCDFNAKAAQNPIMFGRAALTFFVVLPVYGFRILKTSDVGKLSDSAAEMDIQKGKGKSADQQIPDQCSKTATCQQLKDKGFCPSSCGGPAGYGSQRQMSCRFSCGLEAATACRCDCTCKTTTLSFSRGGGSSITLTNASVVLRSESSAPEALVWKDGQLKASCVLDASPARSPDSPWPPTCPSAKPSPRCMFRRTTCSGDRREHLDTGCGDRKNFNYNPGCKVGSSCRNYGGASKMAGFCDCNGNNIRDSGEHRSGCKESSNEDGKECMRMCRQSFCSWTRVAGKFSAGYVEFRQDYSGEVFRGVTLQPAEKAKQACAANKHCQAVTCENSESCSMRSRSTLSTSPSNETTYLLKCSNSNPKLNDLVYGSIVPNKKVNTSACPRGSRPLPRDVCEQVAFAQGSAFQIRTYSENGEALPAGCHKFPTDGQRNFTYLSRHPDGGFTWSGATPYRVDYIRKTQYQTVCQKA